MSCCYRDGLEIENGLRCAIRARRVNGLEERGTAPRFRLCSGKNGLGLGTGPRRHGKRARSEKSKATTERPPEFSNSVRRSAAPGTDARWIKLNYVALKKETEGIDDPRSRYYNQLVDRSKVAKVDWRSSEQMRRNDNLYKWGVVREP